MARLPARRSARNIALVDPSREFEDIYQRMGPAHEHGLRRYGLQVLSRQAAPRGDHRLTAA